MSDSPFDKSVFLFYFVVQEQLFFPPFYQAFPIQYEMICSSDNRNILSLKCSFPKPKNNDKHKLPILHFQVFEYNLKLNSYVCYYLCHQLCSLYCTFPNGTNKGFLILIVIYISSEILIFSHSLFLVMAGVCCHTSYTVDMFSLPSHATLYQTSL